MFPGIATQWLSTGYFKEGQSTSVKNKTTRQEGEWGFSTATPRLTSRLVVLFFTLPLWPSLKYLQIRDKSNFTFMQNKETTKIRNHRTENHITIEST